MQKLANHIADKANHLNLVTGKSPISLAAAAIYMAVALNDNSKTAKDIADVSGVAENTIKQTFKAMQPRMNDLIPSDYKSTSHK